MGPGSFEKSSGKVPLNLFPCTANMIVFFRLGKSRNGSDPLILLLETLNPITYPDTSEGRDPLKREDASSKTVKYAQAPSCDGMVLLILVWKAPNTTNLVMPLMLCGIAPEIAVLEKSKEVRSGIWVTRIGIVPLIPVSLRCSAIILGRVVRSNGIVPETTLLTRDTSSSTLSLPSSGGSNPLILLRE